METENRFLVRDTMGQRQKRYQTFENLLASITVMERLKCQGGVRKNR
jgi:hypothetical protein